MHHRSIFDLLLIHLDHARRDWTSVDEGLVRHRRHRIVHVLVDVVNSRDVGGVVVDDRGVVHVGHLSNVNSSVGDVHVVYM